MLFLQRMYSTVYRSNAKEPNKFCQGAIFGSGASEVDSTGVLYSIQNKSQAWGPPSLEIWGVQVNCNYKVTVTEMYVY